jgi:hypothetical protein
VQNQEGECGDAQGDSHRLKQAPCDVTDQIAILLTAPPDRRIGPAQGTVNNAKAAVA